MIYKSKAEENTYYLDVKSEQWNDRIVSYPEEGIRSLYICDYTQEEFDIFKDLEINEICLEGHVDLDVIGKLESTRYDVRGVGVDIYIFRRAKIVKASFSKIHNINGKYVIGRKDQADSYLQADCSSNGISEPIENLTIFLDSPESIDQFLNIKIPELRVEIPYRFMSNYIIRYDEEDDDIGATRYIGATITRKTEIDKLLYGEKLFMEKRK